MDAIPKEVIERIFGFCQYRELLNLTATCKLFNNIISNNKQFLKKLEIKIKHNVDDTKIWNGTRRYSRLYINKMHPAIPKIIEATKNDLTELAILFLTIDGMDLKKILLDCSKLTKLSITSSVHTYTDECFKEPLPRLMLNELRCSSNRRVLGMLIQCQTKMYENVRERIYSGELVELRKFLKNQQHLEELQLYSFQNDCLLFHDEILNSVDFRLKHFRVNGFGNFNVGNFKKFMENHRESLAHMEIGQIFPNQCPVVKMYQILVVDCIKDFRNLKSLFLREICLNFEPLPYVEKLELMQLNLDGVDEKWSEKFPNVKHLILTDCASTKEITKLSKLETLELVNMEILEQLEIPSTVKHLKLHNVSLNFGFYYDFKNGQIEILEVEYCKEAEWLIDFLNVLNKKLKLLKIFKISLLHDQNFASAFDDNLSLMEKAEKIVFVKK